MNALFLDLEGTIIDEWDSPFIINEKEINRFISSSNYDTFGIFSYAIHNDSDRKIFDRDIKPVIDKILDIEIDPSLIWTPFDVLKAWVEYKKVAGAEFNDVFTWTDKEYGFGLLVRSKFKEGMFSLIDDTVEHTLFQKDRLLIQTFNVGKV